MTTRPRGFLEEMWDFFCSLKLTLFLLISLAIISMIGTVIPQGQPSQAYLERIVPAKLKLYQAMGFFDVYHSWWFILLLYLLTVNLTACSIKRLPHIWKLITEPVTILSSSFEKTLGNRSSFSHSGDQEDIKNRVQAFLKADFAEPILTQSDGSWHLFAQKTPWCRLSVYLVHLSIIIIFIGAIIGSLFGYKGFVNILEGDSISNVMTRSKKNKELGFSVRCEKFTIAFYKNGAPREFKSILTVLENNKPVPGYEKLPIVVNTPLTYKGITFYQSSYGNAGTTLFTVTDLNGKNEVPVSIVGTESAPLPDGSSMHVLETTPDISRYEKGLTGPAARIEIHTAEGTSERVVVYANHPELNIEHAQHHGKGPVIHLKGVQERMYTGLQVARDPGVWIVWFGCLLMVVGIFTAFFMSHRRIWVRIESGTVTVAGNASKNQASFQQSFEVIVEKLKAHLFLGGADT